MQRLMVQLFMLPDVIRTAFLGSAIIKKITNIRTISDAINRSTIYKGMLPEVDKLIKLYMTFPVTSTTAECSLSYKTYLQSTTTECRLKNLLLLYVHEEMTDNN